MKRFISHLRPILTLLFVTAVSVIISSCNNDNDGGTPEITSVRLCDPEKADSTFTMSQPNRTIVIQGHNLGGAKAVYINDQMVSFNPNMNTDHSIIVTIPTEASGFKLTVWNPELRSEIRVVTGGGVATFPFNVLSPRQTIDRVSGPYPRIEGTKLSVYGTNFVDVTRVYFDDINPYYLKEGTEPVKGNETEVQEFSVEHDHYYDPSKGDYVTNSIMTITQPALSFSTGFLIIETLQGHAVIEYTTVPTAPKLIGISSDMPIPGSRVYIRGTNFVAVSSVKIGNDVIIPADDITVEDDESTLSFIMPSKPASTTTISVETAGGESNAFPFYRYETLLVDFDKVGKDLYYNDYVPTVAATSGSAPFVSDGKYAFFSREIAPGTDSGQQLYFTGTGNKSFVLPSFDIIPANTSTDDVYLMFEIYTKSIYTKSVQYGFRWNSDNKDHKWENRQSGTNQQLRPEFQDMFGEQPINEWYTAVMPLSAMTGVYEGMTYQEVVDKGMKRILIMLRNKTESAGSVFICIDNIRISTLPSAITPNGGQL